MRFGVQKIPFSATSSPRSSLLYVSLQESFDLHRCFLAILAARRSLSIEADAWEMEQPRPMSFTSATLLSAGLA